MEIERFLKDLEAVKRTGTGWSARCPAHDDNQNSLSIAQREGGKILLRCFAGCSAERIVKSLGLEMKHLFPQGERGGRTPPQQPCNHATSTAMGCTLQEYGHAKGLPESFLVQLGLKEIRYCGHPAVRIPYFDREGNEVAVRFRTSLNGPERFKWRRGDKPCLYGLSRLEKDAEQVILVEGESDCHTLWYHGIPALGLPGAANWKEQRDGAHLEGIRNIYIFVERDKGGEAVKKWLATSTIRDRAYIVTLDGFKDPSALFLNDPSTFEDQWEEAINNAQKWVEIQRQEAEAHAAEAWMACKELACAPQILDHFERTLQLVGVVGEVRIAKLLYLALTTRLFDMPVSMAVKGPSSGGKSYVTERVCKFFPKSAYYALTAMSERALAYSREPLSHRFLILYEASALTSDLATYLVRSLLSEGHIRYETVEKTKDGMQPLLIERKGPTGLIVTTTAIKLHPENETRLISVTVSDSSEQTKAILQMLADDSRQDVDLSQWHTLQVWLSEGEKAVTIPFARILADMVPIVEVRFRRDFKHVKRLIEAHALLHRATRLRDAAGRIIATIKDYEVVRELASEFIAEGVGASVSDGVREVVAIVENLKHQKMRDITGKMVEKCLAVGKSATSRRIKKALEAGYLINVEERKGRPMKLDIGDPLPEELSILPSVEDLRARLAGCTVAAGEEGVHIPPSPFAHEGELVSFDQEPAYEEGVI